MGKNIPDMSNVERRDAGAPPVLSRGRPTTGALQAAGRQLHDKQLQFVAWLATPAAHRQPSSRAQLAPLLGVTEVTLWRWSKDPRVNEAVRWMTLHMAADPQRISDVLDFYHETVMDLANDLQDRLKAAKLFMDAIGVKYLNSQTPSLLKVREVDEIDISELSDEQVWELYHELAEDAGWEIEDVGDLSKWDTRVRKELERGAADDQEDN